MEECKNFFTVAREKSCYALRMR